MFGEPAGGARGLRGRGARWLALALLPWCAGCVVPLGPRDEDRGADLPREPGGPLAMRVQNPLHLAFLQLPPAGARVLPHGDVEVRWTNQYSSFYREDSRARGATRSLFDGETWRTVAAAAHGLGDGWQIGLRVPFLYGSGGFLDALVEDWHAWLGLTQEGRDENPDDQFAMEVVQDDVVAYAMEDDRFAIADASLELAWNALPPGDEFPAVTLRTALELPTGSAERGFGNDAFDLAFGVALEKELGGFFLHANASYALLGGHDGIEDAGLSVRDTWAAAFAVERPLWPGFAAVVQVQGESSPLRGIDLEDPTDDGWLLTVGGHVQLAKRAHLHLGFAEDLTGKGTQDFTVLLELSIRL